MLSSPMLTRISEYDQYFKTKEPVATLFQSDTSNKRKNDQSGMSVDDLAATNQLDKTRYRKLADDESFLQQIDSFNANRPWTRQMVEYLDHKDPLAVYTFIERFPNGAKTWEKNKRRKSKYIPKKEKKELPPLNQVDDNLYETIGERDLRILREEYQKLTTQVEKREFLKQFYDAETTNFSIHGQYLTWEACRALFGSSYSLIQTVKETPGSRFRDATRLNQVQGSQLLLNKEDIVVAFLRMVEQEFDVSPTKKETYIPFAFQRSLYSTFIDFWIQEVEGGVGHGSDKIVVPPSESYFLRCWKARCPALKCRAYHSFMMCDDCVSLNDRWRLAKTPQERKKIWELRRTHIFMVKEERFDYAQRILLARRRPDLYLHLTVDGSDNSAYGFPHFAERTHSSVKGLKIRSKLYAGILHGHFAACFTYASNLRGGSNVTVEIIHRMLELFINDSPGNKLPPTLWLQLDNTCKDNKNRYVFAYAQLLVDVGLFQEVTINFLPVGHTHCDIDQLFSRISVHLYGSNCWNFEDLLRKAAAASKMVKYCVRLYGFGNWKNHLLSRKLIVAGSGFSGFTKHRKFRFSRVEKLDKDGKVQSWSTCFQMKRSTFHVHWTDLNEIVDGHIKLALKPLTFNNVFCGDLSTLDFIADRVPPNEDKEKDELHKMTKSVINSRHRIKEILGDAKGTMIVDSLLAEVELQRTDKKIPFDWDLSMYRNPPINWDRAVPFVSESNAHMADVRSEAERIVALEDAGGVINKDMTLVNMGDYVICVSNLSSDPLKRPFWVGQVTKNYPASNELRVHWLLPPVKHCVRGGKGKKGKKGESTETVGEEGESAVQEVAHLAKTYLTPAAPPRDRANKPQEPNEACLLKNYPYARFKPVLHINTADKTSSMKGQRNAVVPSFRISYDCVFFSFSNLKSDDRLPTNVLDELSREQDIKWKG